MVYGTEFESSSGLEVSIESLRYDIDIQIAVFDKGS